MKINEAIQSLDLEILFDTGENSEVKNCYICDLLSLVMSRALEGDLWLTVQTNVNVVAVAVLNELAGIVIAEGMEVPAETIEKARTQGVTLLRSPLPAYALAKKAAALLD
jgi:hypothetical protein